MIKIGIIGFGYWGPNLVRNFDAAEDAELCTICDLDQSRLTLAKKLYPSAGVTTDTLSVLNSRVIDAIVVATPVRSHASLGLAALQAGKHLFIEKPIAESSKQARELVFEAENRNLRLMVDHTFIYTSAVNKIHELIKDGELGDIYYYDSTRINLGLYQSDVDVIWDLAVHDLSILSYILNERPLTVSATGTNGIGRAMKDIAYVTLNFGSGLIAHINVNWLSPVKLRRTIIGGSRKMVIYDDLEPNEKIRIYDKGVTITTDPQRVHEMKIGYRNGDLLIPHLDNREALNTGVEHFLDCIRNEKTPKTDGRKGLQVVRMAEAASASMRAKGGLIELKSDD